MGKGSGNGMTRGDRSGMPGGSGWGCCRAMAR